MTGDKVSSWDNPGSITYRLPNRYYVVDAFDTMGDLLERMGEIDDAGGPWPENDGGYVLEHRPLPDGPHIVDLTDVLQERRENAEIERRHRQATRAYV